MKITPSPLCWPVGWKRTKRRAKGPFGNGGSISIDGAVQRLRRELRLMRVHDQDIVISTNLTLRLDGLPRSGQAQPQDPGAAVYWIDPWAKQPRAMAIDQYDKVEQNIAALAATIESMRAIERHGGAKVIERAFTGFVALPEPARTERGWHTVLGVDFLATAEEIEAAYRRLRSERHPDHGGTAAAFFEVQAAYEEAMAEIQAGH